MLSATTSTPNRRPSPEREAMLRREVAQRYAQDAAKKRERSGGAKRPTNRKVARMTVAAIERVFFDRWGSVLPADEAGVDDLEILAQIVAQAFTNPAERIAAYAAKWAPWRTPEQVDELIAYVAAFPLRWDADSLAERLGLTDEVRTRLNIKTIGATDCPKAERAERRKRRDREYQKLRRQENGSTPRESSAARVKPWEKLGISRATWFRRGKPSPEAGTDETVRLFRQQSVAESILPSKSSHSEKGARLSAPVPPDGKKLVQPSRSPRDADSTIRTAFKVQARSEVNARAPGLVSTADTHNHHLASVFSKNQHGQQFCAQPS